MTTPSFFQCNRGSNRVPMGIFLVGRTTGGGGAGKGMLRAVCRADDATRPALALQFQPSMAATSAHPMMIAPYRRRLSDVRMAREVDVKAERSAIPTMARSSGFDCGAGRERAHR